MSYVHQTVTDGNVRAYVIPWEREFVLDKKIETRIIIYAYYHLKKG